jgi:prepilin-type N-terminal cleavage/methylation domain-containing protein
VYLSRHAGLGAFTLIEILVVISILGLLMGLLMPVVTSARRASAMSATQSLLSRVTGGLERFHDEIGVWPYQDHQGVPFPEDNRLAYHLGHALTSGERADLERDADEAAGHYTPVGSGDQIINPSQVDARETQAEMKFCHAYLANRMAGERARAALHAGFLGVRGLDLPGYAFSGTALVAAPRSRGWAADYLGNDLQTKEIRGDAIIDRWGSALIYVCPVLPGNRAVWPNAPIGFSTGTWQRGKIPVSPEYYGLDLRGRTETTVLSSDIRSTAASSFRFTFEIWSRGPDRSCHEQRDDVSNRDNIPAGPYLKGLP